MEKTNVIPLAQPAEFSDVLTEVLRNGATRLITAAIEAEVEAHLAACSDLKLANGRQRIVRHGTLPERKVQTGIGAVKIKAPRTRDRRTDGGEKIRFQSMVLPKYLRRTQSLEDLIPWLFLKGISSGNFQEALAALLGKDAPNLSSDTVLRLTKTWQKELIEWQTRDLSTKEYVYFWVDGIYFQARSETDSECILVIIGATKDGDKELVGFIDGYRESTQSWKELLLDLKKHGLSKPPALAVGDGAMGFWAALREVFPKTRQQRCWVHKTANVLNKMPKSVQAKAKQDLHNIWMTETSKEAHDAFDHLAEKYGTKYDKAVACLTKDRDELLCFYDFPAKHWKHIRTTNPIESTFATVRHRTKRSKGCLSRDKMRVMVFKLIKATERNWRPLDGKKELPKVISGIKFTDGNEVMNKNININQNAA